MRIRKRWAEMSREQTIRPFTRELDAAACYEFRGHQEAFARLKLAAENRHARGADRRSGQREICAIAPLIPKPGSDDERCRFTSAPADLKPRDFYAALLHAVEEAPPLFRCQSETIMGGSAARREAQGERCIVVVIDEAHEMSEAMLLELRFVMSHQMDARSLFPVFWRDSRN